MNKDGYLALIESLAKRQRKIFGPHEPVAKEWMEFAAASVARKIVVTLFAFHTWRTNPQKVGVPGLRMLHFCELFAFVLTHKTRREVFEPFFEEMKQDYLVMRALVITSLGRKWLNFCFGWRTFWMVLDCLRVGFASKSVGVVMKFVPPSWRSWWSSR